MVETLRKLVEKKIDICENPEDRERLLVISKILLDDNCFKMMKTETAYKLLSDIGYSIEEVKKIYLDLML